MIYIYIYIYIQIYIYIYISTYISICIYVNKIDIIKCVYKMCIFKMYNCSTIGLGGRKIIVRKIWKCILCDL